MISEIEQLIGWKSLCYIPHLWRRPRQNFLRMCNCALICDTTKMMKLAGMRQITSCLAGLTQYHRRTDRRTDRIWWQYCILCSSRRRTCGKNCTILTTEADWVYDVNYVTKKSDFKIQNGGHIVKYCFGHNSAAHCQICAKFCRTYNDNRDTKM